MSVTLRTTVTRWPRWVQPAGQLVEGDGGADVAHVRHPLHRGPAVVEAGRARDEGNEVADFGGGGVIESQGHRSRLADGGRLRRGIDQGGGHGGDALAAAGESQPVAGGGRDADRAPRAASLRTVWASSRRGPNLGRFATNWTATLPISKPAARTIRAASASSGHTGGAGELRAGRCRSACPGRRCRRRRTAHPRGVGHGVAVGMARPGRVRPATGSPPSQRARAGSPGSKAWTSMPMPVRGMIIAGWSTVIPPPQRAPSGPSRRPSARIRSSGVVIFRDWVEPRTA